MLVRLNECEQRRATVDSFGGLDRRQKIGAGSFYDMNNMTSSDLPVLSVRGRRGICRTAKFNSAVNMTEVNGDIYCIAKSRKPDLNSYVLFKNTDEVDGFSFNSDAKTSAVMGVWLIIFPDKVMYNTLTGKFKMLERSYGEEMTARLCDSTLNAVALPAQGVSMCIVQGKDKFDLLSSSSGGEEVRDEINRSLALHNYSKDSILLYCPDTFAIKVCPLSSGCLPDDTSALVDADCANVGCIYDIVTGEIYIRSEKKNDKNVYTWRNEMAYIRLSGQGIAGEFSQWDSVTVSSDGADGFAAEYILGDRTVRAVDTDADCIYIRGFVPAVKKVFSSGAVTVTRPVPDMDFICAHENRLYGCRFKKLENGAERSINEIYASKLGEADNFSLSDSDTGAFAMSVGENGSFTGAVSYNSKVYFFKEACVIALDRYFSSEVIRVDGVSARGGDTIALLDGNLIYAGVNGIYLFNGSRTKKISDELGVFNYYPTVGRSYDGKYYLNVIGKSETDALYSDEGLQQSAIQEAESRTNAYMQSAGYGQSSPFYSFYYGIYKLFCYQEILKRSVLNSIKNSRIFVYDGKNGVWTVESISSAASCMCSDGKNLYYIDYSGLLVAQNGIGEVAKNAEFTTEDNFDWFAESGDIGYTSDDRAYISRLSLRIRPRAQTKINLDISYDSSGKWHRLYTLRSPGCRSITLPVIPVRCDTFKIRVSGTGECSFLSASAVYERGSDEL